MPFKKGQSGNPKGRPKRGSTMTDAIKDVLRETDESGVTYRERVARALVDAGLLGNVAAIKEINERLDGRVVEKQEITGGDGGPLKYEHSNKLSPEEMAEAALLLEEIKSNRNGHGASID